MTFYAPVLFGLVLGSILAAAAPRGEENPLTPDLLTKMLADAIEASGIKQSAIAAHMGVSDSLLSQLRAGEKPLVVGTRLPAFPVRVVQLYVAQLATAVGLTLLPAAILRHCASALQGQPEAAEALLHMAEALDAQGAMALLAGEKR